VTEGRSSNFADEFLRIRIKAPFWGKVNVSLGCCFKVLPLRAEKNT
jgi:hypothetical protein